MKKSIAAVMIAAAIAAFGMTACAEEFNPDKVEGAMTIEDVRAEFGEEVPVASGIKFGGVMKALSNEFWRTLEEGYKEAESKVQAAGSDYSIVIDATTDEADEIGQQTMTSNMVNQGVTAILASPISDSNLTSAVEDAQDQGIPVINVNDGLIAAAEYYVGPNAYQNGLLAAEWISKQLGDEGQVAIVIGMPKAFAARERTQGFKDWIAENNSGLEVYAEQNADWDRQTAKNVAATWIQQNPDLKAIF
nr:substrate-binding domain-containing protein [Lachnospiraceae bacterium]